MFAPGFARKRICIGVTLPWTVLNVKNVLSLNKKFNYILLSMRYDIYKCKLNEDALLVPAYINKLKIGYRVEFG